MNESYTITGFKSMISRDGVAFNCYLCRDGKKVAFVTNSGDGGSSSLSWEDLESQKELWKDHRGDEYRVTPEQHLFYKSLESEQKTTGISYHSLVDDFIGNLIDKMETEKREKRWCKNATIYRLKGDKPDQWRKIKQVFTPEIKQKLVETFGDHIEEILNEKFA